MGQICVCILQPLCMNMRSWKSGILADLELWSSISEASWDRYVSVNNFFFHVTKLTELLKKKHSHSKVNAKSYLHLVNVQYL